MGVSADKKFFMENFQTPDLLNVKSEKSFFVPFILGIISIASIVLACLSTFIDMEGIGLATILISFITAIVGLILLSNNKKTYSIISDEQKGKNKLAKILLISGLIISTLFILFAVGILVLIDIGGFSR